MFFICPLDIRPEGVMLQTLLKENERGGTMNTHMMVLAFKFMLEIKDYEQDSTGRILCDSNYKKEVIHDVGEILAGGSITAKEFHDLMEEEKNNPEKASFYKPGSILEAHGRKVPRKNYHDPENLLVLGKFYFHPTLQVTPPAPVLVIEDDGTMTASYENEPFYLEIKDRFTRKDLVRYFYNKNNKEVPEATIARDVGAFDHMLRFWDVDFILYLIDEAFSYSMDIGTHSPKSPLDIQKYESEAALVYDERKKTCFEEGIDRVLPRAIT